MDRNSSDNEKLTLDHPAIRLSDLFTPLSVILDYIRERKIAERELREQAYYAEID